jgi:SSS family solute:Na+ symporter
MTPLDWIIGAIPFGVVLGLGLYGRQFVKSVADFMSGNRSAGRYLLSIAGGELQAGAVVFVASFEIISQSGFTITWWNWLQAPVLMLVGISGFVIYRYRETRAMTLAQFFEIRYSKKLRLFAGILGFGAGILNFGIIPAVGSRCVAYFLGFPETVQIFGLAVPSSIILMACFLSVALFIALSGGLITVMMTNCLEGIMAQILYLVLIFALLRMFTWTQISTVLGTQPTGHSLLNPFDSGSIKDFNLYYILMMMSVGIYGTMAWQNASSYNSAASSAHESRMAAVLSRWLEIGKMAVITLLGVCALTFLTHPAFAAQTGPANAAVHRISDPHTQEQMRMTIALATLLPVGVKGVLCAIFLMGIFGGDATHLHSWGSIFVQDVLLPLRKKPFTPKGHIRALRCSIFGVALFAFIFGCLFRQTQYIAMWWSVTTAIYVGGAGATIIGGLYWKKGTTAGAWSALITGSILSCGGIVLKQLYGDAFPLNLVQVSFFSTLIAITVYVVVSLVSGRGREDYNMDRMLHRGAYAAVATKVGDKAPAPRGVAGWGRYIGIDEDFSFADKCITWTMAGWSFFWLFVLMAGSAWNLVAPWPLWVWSGFWEVVGLGLPVLAAVITGVWFTWGGIRDMRRLFRRLRAQKVNHLDDGTVVNHQNLDETAAAGK